MTKEIEKTIDIRVTLISRILGFSTGMLAICIPLSAATKSGALIPVTLITAASAGSVMVWRDLNQKEQKSNSLSLQIEALEKRISDLETIITSNNFRD